MEIPDVASDTNELLGTLSSVYRNAKRHVGGVGKYAHPGLAHYYDVLNRHNLHTMLMVCPTPERNH